MNDDEGGAFHNGDPFFPTLNVGWMDGWMDGKIDGWKYEWMER